MAPMYVIVYAALRYVSGCLLVLSVVESRKFLVQARLGVGRLARTNGKACATSVRG